MLAKDIISGSFLPLKKTDTGTNALLWMDEYKVIHLPVADNGEYLGILSESDIYSLQDPDDVVGKLTSSLKNISAFEDQHIYEVISLMSSYKLSLLPVVNEKNQFHGVITLSDLVRHFVQLTGAENPGGIIVLEVNEKDYLLTEIAGIVESNNAKIISLYLATHSDATQMEVTLKINTMDMEPILQTFNRYNYQILASFSEEDAHGDLKSRYDSLMRYLNI